MNSDDCCGVIGDVFIVEGKADGTNERGVAVFGFVLGGVRGIAVSEWMPFN